MSGWNPGSAVTTLEQTFRLGGVETRKKIASGIEEYGKKFPDHAELFKDIVTRVKSGEFEIE